jgi:hypothetical protein
MKVPIFSALQVVLCSALCGPLNAMAASGVVVQPLGAPESPPSGPVCSLPPLVEEAPPISDDRTASEEGEGATQQAPSNSTDEAPLLCACLHLDVMVNYTLTA